MVYPTIYLTLKLRQINVFETRYAQWNSMCTYISISTYRSQSLTLYVLQITESNTICTTDHRV